MDFVTPLALVAPPTFILHEIETSLLLLLIHWLFNMEELASTPFCTILLIFARQVLMHHFELTEIYIY